MTDRTITPEQARNVLAALAEEGLAVDHEGFVVPLDPEDFGIVPECEEPGCEGVGEVIDGPRIVCREHAPRVDDATLAMFADEQPKREPIGVDEVPCPSCDGGRSRPWPDGCTDCRNRDVIHEPVFAELRRMGEEARAEPLTAEDEEMLARIKAAVRRKLGEP